MEIPFRGNSFMLEAWMNSVTKQERMRLEDEALVFIGMGYTPDELVMVTAGEMVFDNDPDGLPRIKTPNTHVYPKSMMSDS